MLRDEDIAEIVRLISTASELGGAPSERRAFLFGGMSRLTTADAWVWINSGRNYLGDLPAFVVSQKGGFTDRQFSSYLGEYLSMKELFSKLVAEVEVEKQHVTRLRKDLDPSWLEEGSATRAKWKSVGLGSMLLSFQPPDAGGVLNGLILFRRFDREPFERCDSALVHAILSGVSWLNEDATRPHYDTAAFDMSPRLNAVLNLILQGVARKQVASDLGISINTVGGYIKELYQRFEVHSQAELIRRFVDGGMPHRSPP